MPIGYNPSARQNIGLTFPAVADEHRTLGDAYWSGGYAHQNGSLDVGGDIYGWGRDARHMADAKVASTLRAQRLYDRTPRFRIIPTRLMGSTPFFGAIDQSDGALSKWQVGNVSIHGGGSIGAMSTKEGQKYRRRILDARAQQFAALNATQDTAPLLPTEEKSLTEVEAEKLKLDQEFSAILDEVEAGILERGTGTDLVKWGIKFIQFLPYFNSNDVQQLADYDTDLGQFFEVGVRVMGERERMRELSYADVRKLKAQTEYVEKSAQQIRDVIKQYVKIINYSLQERIMGLRAILKKMGMERIARGIRQATAEDVAEDDQDEEEGGGGGGAFAPYQPPNAQPLLDAGDGEQGDGVDEGADMFAGLDVRAPAIGDRPPYSTQAQITEEMRRRVLAGTEQKRALLDIAEEWRPFTGYNPRPNTDIASIRRTLVARIKALPAVAGRGRRVVGGRSVHHRLRGHQQNLAVRRQMEEVMRR